MNFLATKLIPFSTPVGKSILKDLIHPSLEAVRDIEPEDGVLEDNDIGLYECLLLGCNIDLI